MTEETITQRAAESPNPQQEQPPIPLLRGFLRNLQAAGRLALFRRTGAEAFATLPRDLVLLALADPALNLLASWLLSGEDGVFTPSSLASFSLHIPLFLLCGLAAARLLARPGLVTAVPVAFAALSLVLEALHALLEGAVQLQWLPLPEWLLDSPHYFRFLPWWAGAAALFLMRLGPAPLQRRAASLALFLAVAIPPLLLFPRGDLWTGTRGEGEELQLTEEVLDAQPRLVQEAFGKLLPGRPGVTDLYFVGFAGDGGMGVFMRELLSVERLFAGRFDAAGRSVTLVNNPDTALDYPFATVANLSRTLRRVGEVMNRDEDVLFLFLTSHGSSDGELAVVNGPLELTQVTPEKLRRLLAEAGIKWRVIAVSACFSGTYAEPLQDDQTLILTASDATHESFGCQSGADFTWFGKAYFDEALHSTRSFTDAFGIARETIGAREKDEGESPSNPQMVVGKKMAQKLAELEGRLEAQSTQPPRVER